MINKNKYILLSLFISMCFIANVFAEDSFNEELSKARQLVEQKSYDKALKVYMNISEGLHKNTGLTIEWARVYTYANKHGEAIKLFEEVRSMHPERSTEVLRELAEQYKWNGQIPKAIAVYREGIALGVEDLRMLLGLAEALFWNGQKNEALQIYDTILGRWPDNIDALLGKANILSLQDKLEESYALYQKVLDKYPDNLDALNSQAKILVWQGYFRKGMVRYKEIQNRYPNNPDEIEGMAFAYHRLGDDTRAVEKIRELLKLCPDRKEAQDLYDQIKNSQHPFVRPYGGFTNDSTPQTISTGGVSTGVPLDYSTSLNAVYENQVLRKKSSDESTLSVNRTGLGLYRILGDTYEFHTFLYESSFDKVDFNPFTTNTWVTYKPDDYWRFDLAYDRETFEDNDAILDKIITNSPSLSVDFRPDRYWFLNLKYKRSYFSDNNRQDQVFGTAEYRLSQVPFIKLYYNYYYSNWADPDLTHGYFDPRSLLSHTLGVDTSVDLTKKLSIETKISGGYEFQRKPNVYVEESDHPTFYAEASLNYRFTDNWLLSVTSNFFTTWPDHGQRSYQKRGAFLSMTYNFGANPAGLHRATRPSRPTGE